MSAPHALLALLVSFIWGTNFVLIEYGLDELPPFLFATLRFALVAVPLIFIMPRPNVAWWQLSSYGVFIGFGQFGLLFWIMGDDISPGLASLLIQIQAFFTILLAAFLFKETLHRQQIIALLICLTGLLLIAVYTDSDTTPLGLGVIMVAALSWAAGNLVVKRTGKVNIIAFISWSSLFAVPPLLLMSLYWEGPTLIHTSLAQASASAWAVVAWQTLGNTLIGYGLWNWLLGRYPTSVVTPWALMVPVFGMSASWLLLGETMPWWKMLAALLILAGLLLNVLALRQR